MNIKKTLINGWLVLFSLYLLACNKDVTTLLPGPVDAAVNFYNASEVLSSVDSLRQDNYVFIDDSTAAYPPLFDWYAKDQRTYPLPMGVVSPGGGYKIIDYMRVAVGSHRIMYTGRNATGLLSDTIIDFSRSSFTCLYLAESIANESAYRLVVVPEDRKSPAPGKIGIRIINLCPDVDAFGCARLDKYGNPIMADMPQRILPGTFSSYVEIDTSSSSHNNVFIRFFREGYNDNPLTTAAIPAQAGRTFALVIQGFNNNAVRRIAIRKNENGSLFYDNVNVTGKLRVNVRATY